MRLKFCAFVSVIALFVSLPSANAQIYRAILLGSNEIPAANTPATGLGIITLNRNTHEMRVNANFTGLIGNTTQSHIHCCVVQPANAGVATTLPSFVGFPIGVTSGSWDRIYDMTLASSWNPAFVTNNGGTTAGAETAFFAGVAARQSYLNIHTSAFPGGEIRGTLELFSFAANPGMASQLGGVATALDSLGAGTGSLNNALVSLAFLTPDQQAAALARLTPSSSRGRLAVTAGAFDTNFDTIGNRLDVLRREDRAQSLSGAGNGLWFAGHGLRSRQYREAGFAGYDRDGGGLAGGVDRRIRNGTFIGGAFGYSESDLGYRDQSSGSSDDIRSRQLSGYISQDIGRFFVQGTAGYAWQLYETRRETGVTGIATASFSGSQLGARITLGVPISTSSVSFVPQASLTWAQDEQDAYNEAGGGPLGLAVTEKSVNRLRASVGGQVDFGDRDAGGFKMRPFLRGFYHRQLDDKDRDTTATFHAGGTTFVTPGQKLDRNAVAVGAGINFVREGAFVAGASYDLNLGDSSQSSMLQGRVSWNF
jgi:outer membrane autotransporter protein